MIARRSMTRTSSTLARQIPKIGPAFESTNVFIPLESTAQTLIKLVDVDKSSFGHTTFVRAPVAAGKTTLAKYLATRHSDRFPMVDTTSSEESIRLAILSACGSQETNPSLIFSDLKRIGSMNRVLIFDEAHILFQYPNLVGELFKFPQQWENPPKMLLFSASNVPLNDVGNEVTTHAEIESKFMWYPPIPKGQVLVAELKAAGVQPPLPQV